MQERGLSVDQTTVFRWMQKYAPEINRCMRPHLKMSGTSYRIDETYKKLGRAASISIVLLIQQGRLQNLCSVQNAMFPQREGFKKLMRADHQRLPFSISVDKNAAYPEAFTTSQNE